MDHLLHRVLRFDRFTLDLARGCLYAGDQEIDLRPKTFEVLCYLAARAGRLVSKQELLGAVWPNISVCDDSLFQCIRELRRKLGDDTHRLIKTVSRRGYLLDVAVLAEAQSLPDASAAIPAEGSRKPATKFSAHLRALRTVPAHGPYMWGATGAGIMCVVLAMLHLLGAPGPVATPEYVSLAENGSAEPHPRPTFRDCADCPEMVTLPAGEFTMGSPQRDVGAGLPNHAAVPAGHFPCGWLGDWPSR